MPTPALKQFIELCFLVLLEMKDLQETLFKLEPTTRKGGGWLRPQFRMITLNIKL